jgi:O-antigen/teichoic acid export membrane protein
MAANMGTFILRKGDEVVAGRLVGAHDYGLYNVGADLGSLPVQEIGPAMLRALLPVLASFKDDTARLNAAVVKALAGLNGGIWGISATFAVLAPDVTIVLLGPQWRGASIFVAWFAVVAAAQTACMPLRSYLTLLGETKSQSATVWSEFLVFCCVALAAVPAFGLLGLVMARLTGSVSAGAHLLYQAVRLGRIELRPALISLGRPVLAAILAYAVGFVLAAQLHELVLRMLLAALASAATYVAASTFSWRLAGRPEGIESIVIDLWSSFRGRQRLRWR